MNSLARIRLGRFSIACALALAWTSMPALAGYKAEIGGVTVSYSKAGASAYYDERDATLTVAIGESGGKLKVQVGPSASLSWGNYVDIYILADGASPKSIKITGSDSCTPFVVGEVFYVNTVTLVDGVVGGTDFYGPLFGLAVTSGLDPSKMVLKRSFTTAPLAWVTPAIEESAPAEQKVSPVQPSSALGAASKRVVLRPTVAKQRMIQRVQQHH